MSWWISIFLFIFFALAIGIFAYTKVGFLIKGVDLKTTITATKNSPVITISGNANNSTYLTIDGQEIFIDKKGNFSDKISLLSGLSTISIQARDRFGKITYKNFKFIYNQNKKTIMLGNKIIN